MQMALAFGVVGIAAAVLLTPVLQDASDDVASNDPFGVDLTVTGSVARANRYVIRQSVLSAEPEIICGSGRAQCQPRR